jgi:hypothetical protein
MWFLSGASRTDNIDQQQTAQQAYAKAQTDIAAVYGNGRNLMNSDTATAFTYLSDAYKELAIAEQNSYPLSLLADPQAQVLAGLNQYYHVTIVQPQLVLSFQTDDLEGLVFGPDGAAYVLDNTVNTVYRVNLQTGAKVPVVAVNQEPVVGGGIVGNPRLLTTGGGDVLILDTFNSLWRWHPSAGDKTGRGSLVKVFMPDSDTWGQGPRAMGTFIINPIQNQYNFYIVVPGQQQVLKYPPAPDGSGYPKDGRANYLSVAQDVTKVDDMYVDGKVYIVDKGTITQYQLGQAVHGWTVDPPTDTLIRPKAPSYTRLTADNAVLDQGTFYGYDNLNRRIVAFKKSDGSIVGQYMVPASTPWFSALTGLFVTTGTGGANPTLYWVESGSLMSASLTTSGSSTATPSGSTKPSSSAPGSSVKHS